MAGNLISISVGGTTFINVAATHPFSNTVFREAGC
jgi:hypothetical protein